MTDPLIRADGLNKSFAVPDGDAVAVLAGVTCEVLPERHIALTGPSGSGKSTLMHLMAGLTEPTSGALSWPALGPRERLMPAHIQVVFQAQSLFPPLDVAENVALPLLLDNRGDAAMARAMAMLERFGLEGLATMLPEELSGGQAQRVAMVRALVIAPALILADEPTGQLDGNTAQEFLAEVLAVAAETGTAVLIATHDPRAAEMMDETWVMDHGTLRGPQGVAA